jgi:hypothetical protein
MLCGDALLDGQTVSTELNLDHDKANEKTNWASPDFMDTDQGVTEMIVREVMNACS